MIDWLSLALLLALALFSSAAMAQAPLCVPPDQPWVLDSEMDFREYAGLVVADFERYFSALTQHFQCLETAWQEGIARGRAVAAEREVLVARAEALGLKDRIGVDLPEPLE